VTSHWQRHYMVKAVHMEDNSSFTSFSIISCLVPEIFVQINHILTKFCPWKSGVPVIMTHRVVLESTNKLGALQPWSPCGWVEIVYMTITAAASNNHHSLTHLDDCHLYHTRTQGQVTATEDWRKLNGCIVWNAHNTVFGSKCSAICPQAA